MDGKSHRNHKGEDPMAPSGDYPLSSEVLELLVERGLDAVPELSRFVLDVALQGGSTG